MKLYSKITVGFIVAAAGTAIIASQITETEASTEKPVTYDAPVNMDLNFIFHVDADMAEQDVFIERVEGSGQVYRVTKGDRNMNAPLFRTVNPVEHNPFDPEEIGPYSKGQPLNMTLGEWLSARGKGTYSCVNGKGSIDVNFTGLVPGSVYTMWHFFMAMPPTQPFIGTHDIPMGKRDGSQSVFHSDGNGKAHFKREFTPCLQLTGEHLAAGLAVAWHSDGKTYGPLPGEFATNSHVQLFLGLPKRSGI